jgi:hypothetical protein
MRRLVSGFDPEVSASERWQTMVGERQQALETQICELQSMRKLLKRVQQCRCADLVECGRIASNKPDRSIVKEPALKGRKARGRIDRHQAGKLEQR